MPRRRKIGDLFEMHTAKGFAYLQFCHLDPTKGELVRVPAGLHAERPPDLEEIVAGPLLFWTFVPLGTALHYKDVAYVGNFPVPDEACAWPLLRSVSGLDERGRISCWKVWTRNERGEQVFLRRVCRPLSDEDKKISLSSIPGKDILLAWIEGQLGPENQE